MRKLMCRDAGLDCNTEITGRDDDEVMRKAAEHGQKQHGLGDLTDELKNRLRSLIKEA